MALGGYKFSGYKCAKGTLSDTQFCLLMHKTRLKAFIHSCTLSGAEWAFCKNGGTIDFESNTGVIYDLDGNGYNYASFFQYGSDDKYLAILSMPNQTYNLSSGALLYDDSSTSSTLNTYYFTMFHCASLDPFDDYQFVWDGHNYPTRALQIMPVSNFYPRTYTLATLSTQWSFFESASNRGSYCYFGYATKDSKIITFASTSDLSYFDYGYINATLIGFDAMQLSSPNDTTNLFSTVLRKKRTGEIGWTDESQIDIHRGTMVLNDHGVRYNTYGFTNHIGFLDSRTAITNGSGNTVPYSAVLITGIGYDYSGARTTSPLLNSDGILSKGVVDIDFVATNVRDGTELTQYATFANGNYILASRGTGFGPQYYVGWDPSNPNILMNSSWIEYTL